MSDTSITLSDTSTTLTALVADSSTTASSTTLSLPSATTSPASTVTTGTEEASNNATTNGTAAADKNATLVQTQTSITSATSLAQTSASEAKNEGNSTPTSTLTTAPFANTTTVPPDGASNVTSMASTSSQVTLPSSAQPRGSGPSTPAPSTASTAPSGGPVAAGRTDTGGSAAASNDLSSASSFSSSSSSSEHMSGSGSGSNSSDESAGDEPPPSSAASSISTMPPTTTAVTTLFRTTLTSTTRAGNFSNTTTVPTTTTPDPPAEQFSVGADAVTAMRSTAGLMSLIASVVNPSLCPHAARISLLLDQSLCQYRSLNRIEVVFYPLQFGIGNDSTARYFAAAVFLWPVAMIFVIVHFAMAKRKASQCAASATAVGLGDESLSDDAEALERRVQARERLARMRVYFPSLTVTAITLFFWQPLTNSCITVLSRGEDNQPARFIACTLLLIAFVAACFASRWFLARRPLLEFVPWETYYQRRRAFVLSVKEGQDALSLMEGNLLKSEETAAPPPTKALLTGGMQNNKIEESTAVVAPTALNKARFAVSGVPSGKKAPLALHQVPCPYDGLLPRDHDAEYALAVARLRESGATDVVPTSFIDRLTPTLRVYFLGPGKWADLHGYFGFGYTAGFVYKRYRDGRQWFLLVELVFCTFFGVLEGAKPLTLFGCWATATATFTCLALYFVLLCVLRPFMSPFDNVSFAFLTVTQSAAAALLLVAGKAYERDIRGAGEKLAFACLSAVTAKAIADAVVKVIVHRVKYASPQPGHAAEAEANKAAMERRNAPPTPSEGDGEGGTPMQPLLPVPPPSNSMLPPMAATGIRDLPLPPGAMARKAAAAEVVMPAGAAKQSPLLQFPGGGGGSKSSSPPQRAAGPKILSDEDAAINLDF